MPLKKAASSASLRGIKGKKSGGSSSTNLKRSSSSKGLRKYDGDDTSTKSSGNPNLRKQHTNMKRSSSLKGLFGSNNNNNKRSKFDDTSSADSSSKPKMKKSSSSNSFKNLFGGSNRSKLSDNFSTDDDSSSKPPKMMKKTSSSNSLKNLLGFGSSSKKDRKGQGGLNASSTHSSNKKKSSKNKKDNKKNQNNKKSSSYSAVHTDDDHSECSSHDEPQPRPSLGLLSKKDSFQELAAAAASDAEQDQDESDTDDDFMRHTGSAAHLKAKSRKTAGPSMATSNTSWDSPEDFLQSTGSTAHLQSSRKNSTTNNWGGGGSQLPPAATSPNANMDWGSSLGFSSGGGFSSPNLAMGGIAGLSGGNPNLGMGGQQGGFSSNPNLAFAMAGGSNPNFAMTGPNSSAAGLLYQKMARRASGGSSSAAVTNSSLKNALISDLMSHSRRSQDSSGGGGRSIQLGGPMGGGSPGMMKNGFVLNAGGGKPPGMMKNGFVLNPNRGNANPLMHQQQPKAIDDNIPEADEISDEDSSLDGSIDNMKPNASSNMMNSSNNELQSSELYNSELHNSALAAATSTTAGGSSGSGIGSLENETEELSKLIQRLEQESDEMERQLQETQQQQQQHQPPPPSAMTSQNPNSQYRQFLKPSAANAATDVPGPVTTKKTQPVVAQQPPAASAAFDLMAQLEEQVKAIEDRAKEVGIDPGNNTEHTGDDDSMDDDSDHDESSYGSDNSDCSDDDDSSAAAEAFVAMNSGLQRPSSTKSLQDLFLAVNSVTGGGGGGGGRPSSDDRSYYSAMPRIQQLPQAPMGSALKKTSSRKSLLDLHLAVNSVTGGGGGGGRPSSDDRSYYSAMPTMQKMQPQISSGSGLKKTGSTKSLMDLHAQVSSVTGGGGQHMSDNRSYYSAMPMPQQQAPSSGFAGLNRNISTKSLMDLGLQTTSSTESFMDLQAQAGAATGRGGGMGQQPPHDTSDDSSGCSSDDSSGGSSDDSSDDSREHIMQQQAPVSSGLKKKSSLLDLHLAANSETGGGNARSTDDRSYYTMQQQGQYMSDDRSCYSAMPTKKPQWYPPARSTGIKSAMKRNPTAMPQSLHNNNHTFPAFNQQLSMSLHNNHNYRAVNQAQQQQLSTSLHNNINSAMMMNQPNVNNFMGQHLQQSTLDLDGNFRISTSLHGPAPNSRIQVKHQKRLTKSLHDDPLDDPPEDNFGNEVVQDHINNLFAVPSEETFHDDDYSDDEDDNSMDGQSYTLSLHSDRRSKDDSLNGFDSFANASRSTLDPPDSDSGDVNTMSSASGSLSSSGISNSESEEGDDDMPLSEEEDDFQSFARRGDPPEDPPDNNDIPITSNPHSRESISREEEIPIIAKNAQSSSHYSKSSDDDSYEASSQSSSESDSSYEDNRTMDPPEEHSGSSKVPPNSKFQESNSTVTATKSLSSSTSRGQNGELPAYSSTARSRKPKIEPSIGRLGEASAHSSRARARQREIESSRGSIHETSAHTSTARSRRRQIDSSRGQIIKTSDHSSTARSRKRDIEKMVQTSMSRRRMRTLKRNEVAEDPTNNPIRECREEKETIVNEKPQKSSNGPRAPTVANAKDGQGREEENSVPVSSCDGADDLSGSSASNCEPGVPRIISLEKIQTSYIPSCDSSCENMYDSCENISVGSDEDDDDDFLIGMDMSDCGLTAALLMSDAENTSIGSPTGEASRIDNRRGRRKKSSIANENASILDQVYDSRSIAASSMESSIGSKEVDVVTEARRVAAEKVEQERIQREKEEQERIQREKEEQEHIQREKEEQERIQKEKEEQERIQKEKEEQERIQKEKQERERIQKEKEEQERIQEEQQEQERIQKEKEEQERRRIERIVAAKAEAERQKAELLILEAKEKAEQERLAREKAEEQSRRALEELRALKEQARIAQEQLTREKAEEESRRALEELRVLKEHAENTEMESLKVEKEDLERIAAKQKAAVEVRRKSLEVERIEKERVEEEARLKMVMAETQEETKNSQVIPPIGSSPSPHLMISIEPSHSSDSSKMRVRREPCEEIPGSATNDSESVPNWLLKNISRQSLQNGSNSVKQCDPPEITYASRTKPVTTILEEPRESHYHSDGATANARDETRSNQDARNDLPPLPRSSIPKAENQKVMPNMISTGRMQDDMSSLTFPHVSGNGRRVSEWKSIPTKLENRIKNKKPNKAESPSSSVSTTEEETAEIALEIDTLRRRPILPSDISVSTGGSSQNPASHSFKRPMPFVDPGTTYDEAESMTKTISTLTNTKNVATMEGSSGRSSLEVENISKLLNSTPPEAADSQEARERRRSSRRDWRSRSKEGLLRNGQSKSKDDERYSRSDGDLNVYIKTKKPTGSSWKDLIKEKESRTKTSKGSSWRDLIQEKESREKSSKASSRRGRHRESDTKLRRKTTSELDLVAKSRDAPRKEVVSPKRTKESSKNSSSKESSKVDSTVTLKRSGSKKNVEKTMKKSSSYGKLSSLRKSKRDNDLSPPPPPPSTLKKSSSYGKLSSFKKSKRGKDLSPPPSPSKKKKSSSDKKKSKKKSSKKEKSSKRSSSKKGDIDVSDVDDDEEYDKNYHRYFGEVRKSKQKMSQSPIDPDDDDSRRHRRMLKKSSSMGNLSVDVDNWYGKNKKVSSKSKKKQR